MPWRCTCPDATKIQQGNWKQRTTRTDRDWSSSNAGATNGVCKHIIAAKIAAGLKIDIPIDVPLPSAMARQKVRGTARDPLSSWAKF